MDYAPFKRLKTISNNYFEESNFNYESELVWTDRNMYEYEMEKANN